MLLKSLFFSFKRHDFFLILNQFISTLLFLFEYVAYVLSRQFLQFEADTYYVLDRSANDIEKEARFVTNHVLVDYIEMQTCKNLLQPPKPKEMKTRLVNRI